MKSSPLRSKMKIDVISSKFHQNRLRESGDIAKNVAGQEEKLWVLFLDWANLDWGNHYRYNLTGNLCDFIWQVSSKMNLSCPKLMWFGLLVSWFAHKWPLLPHKWTLFHWATKQAGWAPEGHVWALKWLSSNLIGPFNELIDVQVIYLDSMVTSLSIKVSYRAPKWPH